MRRLVITENFGVWTAETSGGVRATGPTVEAAVEKLLPVGLTVPTEYLLSEVFAAIRPIDAGQISSGVQGG